MIRHEISVAFAASFLMFAWQFWDINVLIVKF